MFCRLLWCELVIFSGSGAVSSRWRRGESSGCAMPLRRENRSAWTRCSPKGIATRALRAQEVFWTNEPSRTPGINLDLITKFKVQQFLAVPLLGASGIVLGMFGVVDRLDGAGVSPEDIRRARALSNQAAVVLESARNLHLSEQHRRRAEALTELARQIDGTLRLPEFAQRFLRRTADLIGARAGLLAVLQEGRWQVAALHIGAESSSQISGEITSADAGHKVLPSEETHLAPADGLPAKPHPEPVLDLQP